MTPRAETMALITGKALTKDYQLGSTSVHALRGVDLEIERGEYVCIAGPSGAGKSTLLNLVGLLDTPSEGSLIFDGTDILSLSSKQRHRFRKERIAFIFQTFNLIPVLDAYENIEFPLLIQKVPKPEREQRIRHFTEAVGIDTLLHHKPDELSGGQRQRAAVARALVTKPRVVLADEPTANLDSVTGQSILDLLRQINRDEGTTFVIASHDHAIMDQADRVIRVVDGTVVA